MLCQSIIGVSDSDIINDYHKSHATWKNSPTAAAGPEKGKLDKNAFAGAPIIAMSTTLSFLNKTYGSISLYLDKIGFDSKWRSRMRKSIAEDEQILLSKL